MCRNSDYLSSSLFVCFDPDYELSDPLFLVLTSSDSNTEQEKSSYNVLDEYIHKGKILQNNPIDFHKNDYFFSNRETKIWKPLFWNSKMTYIVGTVLKARGAHMSIFSRDEATLYEGVSVRWSDGRAVSIYFFGRLGATNALFFSNFVQWLLHKQWNPPPRHPSIRQCPPISI